MMTELTKELREKIDLARKFLEPGYIENKVNNGFIPYPEFSTVLNKITTSLESVYPGMWDIQFFWKVNKVGERVGFATNLMYVIIKFPELTITNSSKYIHLLKDLYVRIPIFIRDTGLEIKTIEGTRLTLSDSEINNSYYHSHLPQSTQPSKFETFCTGVGEINNLTSLLNSGFDEDLFKMYLMHLETFVGWESIEGTPYRYIKSLIESTDVVKSVPISTLPTNYNRIITHLKVHPSLKSKVQWKINRNKYEVVDNLALEEMLMEVFRGYDNYLCIKNNKGEYVIKRKPVNQSHTSRSKYLIFNGRKEYYKLVGDFEPPENYQLYVNPTIKNYFKKQIEYAANNKAITANYTKG